MRQIQMTRRLAEPLKTTCDISLKTFLTVPEVCTYTGLSRTSIAKAREELGLPSMKVMGKITFERARVDEWMKKQGNKNARSVRY
ncbi:helix-turn-helix domain-containing protein [Bacteroides reticulotermitis]|uniref:helix-turn-helix domain-containing protein n=1 Tax=Bacteroides reticulotermitis TaxID=1133319 RepID=UPI003A85C938